MDLLGTQPIKRRLSQKEFSELIGKTPAWVCQLVKDGVLLAGKDGRLDEEENLARYDRFSSTSRADKIRKAVNDKNAAKAAEEEEGDLNLEFGRKADAELKKKFFEAEEAELRFKVAANKVIELESQILVISKVLGIVKTKFRSLPSSLLQETEVYHRRAAQAIVDGMDTRELYADLLQVYSKPVDDALTELSEYDPATH